MQFDDLIRLKGPAAALLVSELCERELPGVKVATHPKDCAQVEVPNQWIELLKAQLDAKVIPWDLVWEKAAHWFPSVRRFVVEKCCGIGVAVEGPLAPSLTYVFPLISGGGRIFQGSVPSGEPGLEAGNSVNLPIDFNVFFQSVHNGFVNDVGVGIWPFKKSMMSDLISVSDAFGDEEGIPFDLSHLVVLYSNGSGDYICVDVSQSASNKIVGGTYWHDDPFESVFNRDVKKLVNEKFDSRSTAFATRAQ